MKTTLSSYRESARNHNLIPVVKEVLADMETPVSVLGKFALRERVFLLESVEGGETWGRYSFLGVDPEPFLELDHAAAAPNPARPAGASRPPADRGRPACSIRFPVNARIAVLRLSGTRPGS